LVTNVFEEVLRRESRESRRVRVRVRVRGLGLEG
jgi:hypothetical protein